MSRADYVEMTTTSIAGTGGDGAVTLSAQTGFPTFTQVFGANPRDIDYVIEDTVNHFFEKGYGIISGGVLTRSTIHETWDGTTYTSVNASALAFGSAPTTGNIRVRMDPTADAADPAMPALINNIGSGIYLGYQFSAHINPYGNATLSGAIGTAVEVYAPFRNLIRGKVDGFGLHIAAAGSAGAGVKAAIYEVGPTGRPGSCIAQFNALPAAATGWITDTASGTWLVNSGPLRLSPGWFYIGYMANDAAIAPGQLNNSRVLYSPLGQADGYGNSLSLRKTAQNSYATGMPTGTPTETGGAYSLIAPGTVALGLRINN